MAIWITGKREQLSHSPSFVYYIQHKTMDVTIGKIPDKLAAEGIKEEVSFNFFFCSF